jgi:hypothetical protein
MWWLKGDTHGWRVHGSNTAILKGTSEPYRLALDIFGKKIPLGLIA